MNEFVMISSQRVGASKYGVKPRFVRPPEKPKTDLQRLMLKAGAVATANILSSRFSSEGKLDRGRTSETPVDFNVITGQSQQLPLVIIV